MPTSRPEGRPEDVLDLVPADADLVVGMANGEPVAVLDALEEAADQLSGVRVHQMHALRSRPSIEGELPGLRHVSLFLSDATRRPYHEGRCEFLPANFSEVPELLRRHTRCSLLLAAASAPDADGWCTLGTNAEYVAALLGEAPVFLEVNARMPRTEGRHHRIHLSEVAGWCAVDRPLVTHPRAVPDERDHAIAAAIAERIPDESTLQVGIGAVPEAVLAALRGHRDLAVHTELMSDGIMELVERGVVTGARRRLRPGRATATFALGSDALLRWLDANPVVEMEPVDWVNDPRTIAEEPGVVSINATTEVDLYGQCASETIGGRPWSGTGGQADFARGAMWSPGGEAFVVLHSTTSSGFSRVRATLTPGSVVTTAKNAVDHVVTEHGIATLRGRTLSERARSLVAIAAPEHRDDLEREARERGLLRPPGISLGPRFPDRRRP